MRQILSILASALMCVLAGPAVAQQGKPNILFIVSDDTGCASPLSTTMLEWAQAGGGARLMMLVHHDDAGRERAYDAQSKIGTFSDSLMAEAGKQGWSVISAKKGWKAIFPDLK